MINISLALHYNNNIAGRHKKIAELLHDVLNTKIFIHKLFLRLGTTSIIGYVCIAGRLAVQLD